MQEIREVDEATGKQTSNSQKTESYNGYLKKEGLTYKPQPGFHSSINAYNPTDVQDPINNKLSGSNVVGRQKSSLRTKNAYQNFKGNRTKNMNQEDLVAEINELKKSNRRDLDEIKKLKSEQLKIQK